MAEILCVFGSGTPAAGLFGGVLLEQPEVCVEVGIYVLLVLGMDLEGIRVVNDADEIDVVPGPAGDELTEGRICDVVDVPSVLRAIGGKLDEASRYGGDVAALRADDPQPPEAVEDDCTLWSALAALGVFGGEMSG